MCVIFDIDGVLADNRHRFKLIEQAPKDWEEYYRRLSDDPPHEKVVEVLHALARFSTIVLCTGRPAKYRAATVQWLKDKSMWDDVSRLFMREDGNFKPNPEVKEVMARYVIEQVGPIGMVFEDDTRSVEMWRKYAPIVMEVKHGQ